MRQFLKFALVGLLNTAVDLAVLNALAYAFRIDGGSAAYAACKAVSFIAAVMASYFLNRRFVFGAAENGGPGRAGSGGAAVSNGSSFEKASFLAVSLAGLLVNTGVSAMAFRAIIIFASWTSHAAALNVAALAGTAAVLMWNYFGYKKIVFGRSFGRTYAHEQA